MKKINLEIVSPDGVKFNKEIYHCQLPGYTGSIGVLSDHIPYFTVFKIGIVKIDVDKSGDKIEYFAVAGGVIQIENNKVIVLAESVENGKEIDIKRAKEAEKNNLALLEKTDTFKEREKINYLVEKARNRIQVFNYAYSSR